MLRKGSHQMMTIIMRIIDSANSPVHGLTEKKCADNEYEFGNLPDQPSNELAFNLQLLDRNSNVDDNNNFEDMLSQNSNNIDEFYDAICKCFSFFFYLMS